MITPRKIQESIFTSEEWHLANTSTLANWLVFTALIDVTALILNLNLLQWNAVFLNCIPVVLHHKYM